MQDIVLKAIAFTAKAHADQKDKAGEPYILHCLRVLDAVKSHGASVDAQCASVLHDVVEDCPGIAPVDLIIAGFSWKTARLVSALTRDTDYTSYINNLSGEDEETRLIKLCDLADNLDPERLAKLPPEMRGKLIAKYRPAIPQLY